MHARMTTWLCAVSFALCFTAGASETAPHAIRADRHAPIGVMGDHLHAAGEWMLSYRFSQMNMNGNRDGTRGFSSDEVIGSGFAATPTDMQMRMHMVGLMYAPTNWLTLMTMVPFVQLEMDHVTGMGAKFETTASNIGDIKLTGLLRLWQHENHQLHFNAGFSLPSGSIEERDTALTPMGARRVRLPYPMQTGSGSFDVLPGMTYTAFSDGFSWGAQAMGTLRTHDNDNEYRLGNGVDLTGWIARAWSAEFSSSLRVAWKSWGNIHGSDPRLNPAVIPTADPDRRAGERLELIPGFNLELPLGLLGTHRFAFELAIPVFQRLDGPQLETDTRITVGWQRSFGGGG